MFLYKVLEYPLITELVFFLFWIFITVLYNYILKNNKFSFEINSKLILLYLFLSFISVLRIYFDFLPFTPDSIYYLDMYIRNDPIGPGFYERIIILINTLFGENVKILIIINILIYCMTISELIKIIPNYNYQNLNLFFIFSFFLPSVIWFIPNILRESIFIYFIVMIMKNSLIIDNKKNKKIQINIIFLFLFSFLAFALRPQILPILFIWLSYIFFKRNKLSIIVSSLIAFIVVQSNYIQTEIIRKLSFHYLESFKTEASGNLEKIAFSNLIIPENIFDVVYYSPYLIIRFLFSPFPWDLSNVKYAFAYLDSLFVCLFFIFIIINFIKKRNFSYSIILFSILFIFILSIFEISFTGAVRHRLPFIITLLPCIVNVKLGNK